MGGTPVTVISSGGKPVTDVDGAVPVTHTSVGAVPVTLADNGKPVTFVTDSLARAPMLSSLVSPYNPIAVLEAGDLSSLFQESSGETRVLATNDPNGLWLDRSQMGVETAESFTLRQPDLSDTINTAAAWTAYGANTVEDEDGAVKITYVDSGTGAYTFLRETLGLSENLVAGQWYELTGDAKVNMGSVDFQIVAASSIQLSVSSTSYIPLRAIFEASSATDDYFRQFGMSAGEILWFKNLALRKIPGNHFAQTTSTKRPLYKLVSGYPCIETDGSDDFLGPSLFSFTQPSWRISVIRQITWTSADRIFSGGTGDHGLLWQSGVSPEIRLWNGSNIGPISPSLGDRAIITAIRNGASSSLQLNNETAVTGDPGSTDADGMTIGATGGGLNNANIAYYAIAAGTGPAPSNLSEIKNYLAARYGVTL